MACEHFPQVTIDNCPLCFPETDYEIKQQTWKNEPIVEVFRDGKPWDSPVDRHFRFGRVKTAMILYCIDTIQDFALTGTMIPSPIIKQPDPDLAVRIQTFPAFTTSYGRFVDEPFMRLERINPVRIEHTKFKIAKQSIGFGQVKAAALVVLKNDIDKWLRSVGGWRS